MEHGGIVEQQSSFLHGVDTLLNFELKAEDVHCCVCDALRKVLIPACRVCLVCGDNLCDECAPWHTSSTSTHAHVVAAIADVENGKFKVDAQRKYKCDVHSDRYLEFRCLSCSENLCPVDILCKHKGHELEYLDDTARKCRTKMTEIMRTITYTIAGPIRKLLDGLYQKTELVLETRNVSKYTIGKTLDEFGWNTAADDAAEKTTIAKTLLKSASLLLTTVQTMDLANNLTLLNFYPGICNCMEQIMNRVNTELPLDMDPKVPQLSMTAVPLMELDTNDRSALKQQGSSPSPQSQALETGNERRRRASVAPQRETDDLANGVQPGDHSPMTSVSNTVEMMDATLNQIKSESTIIHKQCKGNEELVYGDGHDKESTKSQPADCLLHDKEAPVHLVVRGLAVVENQNGKNKLTQPNSTRHTKTINKASPKSKSKGTTESGLKVNASIRIVGQFSLYDYLNDSNFACLDDSIPSGNYANVFLVCSSSTANTKADSNAMQLTSCDD